MERDLLMNSNDSVASTLESMYFLFSQVSTFYLKFTNTQSMWTVYKAQPTCHFFVPQFSHFTVVVYALFPCICN